MWLGIVSHWVSWVFLSFGRYAFFSLYLFGCCLSSCVAFVFSAFGCVHVRFHVVYACVGVASGAWFSFISVAFSLG